MNPKRYGTAAEKQKAYRERQKEVPETSDSKQERPEHERPAEATDAEWEYCLKRAALAREYAKKFPGHVRPSEEVCQSPLWQWQNEVKGRRIPA